MFFLNWEKLRSPARTTFKNPKIYLLIAEAATKGCFIRKGVHRSFAKFTGKRLWKNLFLNKVACLKPS